MSGRPKRTVSTGRDDTLGRGIKVSEQAASNAVTAPLPPADISMLPNGYLDALAREGVDVRSGRKDPDEWSWTHLAEEHGDLTAARLYVAHRGSLGAALGVYNRRPVASSPPVQSVQRPSLAESAANEKCVNAELAAWRAAGVRNLPALKRCVDAGLTPESFNSPNRAVRREAAELRGDITFERELLPAAYDVGGRSRRPELAGRTVRVPDVVGADGATPVQAQDQQLAYIAGYVNGLVAISDARQQHGAQWADTDIVDSGPIVTDRSDLDVDKWRSAASVHARIVEQFIDDQAAGNVDTVTVNHNGRRLRLKAVIGHDDQKFDGQTGAGTIHTFGVDDIIAVNPPPERTRR